MPRNRGKTWQRDMGLMSLHLAAVSPPGGHCQQPLPQFAGQGPRSRQRWGRHCGTTAACAQPGFTGLREVSPQSPAPLRHWAGAH